MGITQHQFFFSKMRFLANKNLKGLAQLTFIRQLIQVCYYFVMIVMITVYSGRETWLPNFLSSLDI